MMVSGPLTGGCSLAMLIHANPHPAGSVVHALRIGVMLQSMSQRPNRRPLPSSEMGAPKQHSMNWHQPGHIHIYDVG